MKDLSSLELRELSYVEEFGLKAQRANKRRPKRAHRSERVELIYSPTERTRRSLATSSYLLKHCRNLWLNRAKRLTGRPPISDHRPEVRAMISHWHATCLQGTKTLGMYLKFGANDSMFDSLVRFRGAAFSSSS
jgi:hypothetical protein